MRLAHSIRGRCLAVLRACGYRGDALHYGVRFPVRLAPTPAILADLDAQRFERSETRLIRQFLPRDVDVLELGGSLGVTSCVILSRGVRRLVSYEAVPALAAIGRQVVAHNHPGADFLSVNRAIGLRGETHAAFCWSADSPLTGALGAAPSCRLTELCVPADDLAAACEKHGIGPGAWLVCDVEGMEFELIERQSAALERFAGVIMECHSGDFAGRRRDQSEAEALLAAQGFLLRKRLGQVVCMTRRGRPVCA